MNRQTLKAKALKEAVAAFGGVAAVVAFLPSRAAVRNLTGEPDGTIGVSAANGDRVAVLVFGL